MIFQVNQNKMQVLKQHFFYLFSAFVSFSPPDLFILLWAPSTLAFLLLCDLKVLLSLLPHLQVQPLFIFCVSIHVILPQSHLPCPLELKHPFLSNGTLYHCGFSSLETLAYMINVYLLTQRQRLVYRLQKIPSAPTIVVHSRCSIYVLIESFWICR